MNFVADYLKLTSRLLALGILERLDAVDLLTTNLVQFPEGVDFTIWASSHLATNMDTGEVVTILQSDLPKNDAKP